MANTLKFGNENWATKKDTILAYNDENANFKPLPFTASRASTATRVNKSGLIETVESGVPRVDYLGNTKGALLLEPQTTNNFVQSNQFDTTWVSSNSTIAGNQIGVGGSLNAWKLTENSLNGEHFVRQTPNVGGIVTVSIYGKANTRDFLYIRSVTSGVAKRIWFNLKNGAVGVNQGISAEMISMGDGWYRCIATFDHQTNFEYYVGISDENGVASYQGNGVGSIYIQYAQLEQSSYATSYIPTAGNAITRLADTASQTVPDGIIGQTEGVLFIDFIHEDSIASDRFYASLTNGGSNHIAIGHYSTTLYMRIFNGSQQAPIDYNQPLVVGRRYKVAINYALNNVSFYVDGVLFATDTNATIPTTSVLSLQRGSFIQTNKVNDLRVYNTALTDAELVTLTTI